MKMIYQKIMTFSYTHDYYPNDKPPTLFDIKALAQSQALIDDLGLIFRQTEMGFYIAAKCDQFDTTNYANAFVAGKELSFAFYSLSPYFLNYTDLPKVSLGKQCFVAYSSQNTSTAVKIELLEKKEKGLLVNREEFQVVQYTLAEGAQAENGHMVEGQRRNSIKGGQGNPLYPSSESYYLDMSQRPDGIYQVLSANEEKRKALYVNRQLMASPPLMILTFQ